MNIAAFIAFHDIKTSRFKRKVLNFSSDLTDNNHSKAADSVKSRVREHIEMFPASESYCSRSKNEHKNTLIRH